MEDHALLREFAEKGSEDAFREIVRRHLDAVYSSARRQLGDPHLAEEVTQAVFVVLARKAASIRPGTVVSAWLFTTTRFVARDALKREQRRHRREQEAALMMPDYHDVEVAAAWDQVAPKLDAALADLRERDRTVLLMRFFENESHAGIARRLGTEESAAKKRVHRAMERLGRLLRRRGVTLSAAMLLTAITSNAVQAAPAGLASAIAAGAIGSAVTGSVAACVQGGLKLMAWSQVQGVTTAAFVAATVVGATFLGVRFGLQNRPVTLPDGSTLSLHESRFASQYGLSHTTLAKWPSLNRTLPEALKQWAPVEKYSGSIGVPSATGTNSLFVALRHDPTGPGAGQVNVVRMVFLDDHGEECGGGFRAAALSMDALFPVVTFPAHPRRSPDLRVRVLGFPGGSGNALLQPLAEYGIPNPTPGRYPQWTPEPLPQTRKDRDFSVTLTQWETGGMVPVGARHDDAWVMKRGAAARWRGTRLQFQVNDSGRRAEAVWVPATVTWSDATGNQWKQFQHPEDALLHDGEVGFASVGVLWPGEDAWRARVEFVRRRDFDAGDLITLPPVSVPDPAELVEINTPFEMDGVVLQLKAICGTKARLPGNLQWSTVEGRVNLVVRCPAPREGRRLTLVQALDDRGRPVSWDPVPWSDAPTTVFGLEVPQGSRHLTFTFAAPRSRFVEFLAAPRRISPSVGVEPGGAAKP